MFSGWRKHYGWLIAAITHVHIFFGFGTLSSYVVLYIELEKEFPTASATAVGWVASVAWGLSAMMSVVTSPLYERYGHQKIIAVGVLLAVLGVLGTTFAPNIWVMYLTFGVIFGGGFNFVYNPSIHLVTVYFPKENSTRATAIAAMGASIGLLAMCPLLDIGFHHIGWRNSYRLLSAVYLLVSLPLCFFMKPPGPNYHKPSTDSNGLSDEKGQHIVQTVAGDLQTKPQDEKDAENKVMCNSQNKDAQNNFWKKYLALLKLPQHWFYFFGTIGGTLAAVFNNINLGSLFTHAGYDEDKATFFITAMTIAELITRVLIVAFGDCLPCARSLLFPIVCSVAGTTCLLLGLWTDFVVIIIYLAGIGMARGFLYSMTYGVAVEVFTAEKSVEVYTSLLVAYGLGGILASTIPGLSFDLTGSYAASLYICAGIWWLCGLLYLALYISYRRQNRCIIATSSNVEVQKPNMIDNSEGYATGTSLNDDLRNL